jgi:hypothetical protein
MGSTHQAGYEHLEGLLFVTTGAAKAAFGAEAIALVENIVDAGLFFTIPGAPATVYDAVKSVGPILRANSSIKGVVVLGDYETVPSRKVQTLSYDVYLKEKRKYSNLGGDLDLWRVWNDDLYGDTNDDRLGDLPVSRVPIVPQDGNILGDPRGAPRPDPSVIGLRSEDLDFALRIYSEFLGRDEMKISPPVGADIPAAWPAGTVADDLASGDLAMDRLYLVLHSSSNAKATFKGRTDGPNVEEIDAIDFTVAGGEWQARGVAFTGACWGALSATSASATKWDPLVTWIESESIALSVLYRGAKAVVGFTALHYVPPNDSLDLVSGAPLHRYFWKNVVKNQWPPAEALFQARSSFIADAGKQSTDPVTLAKHVKTYWSATCLGVGW